MEKTKLALQEELKNLLIKLRREEDCFLANPSDNATATALVILAQKTLKMIQEMRLESIFPQDLLKDLAFYSSIAAKNKQQLALPQ